MHRAIHIHNQICGLLLASYESLQEHIINMSSYLSEYQRKSLDFGKQIPMLTLTPTQPINDITFFCNLEFIDCQEKMHKLSEIANMCSDAEALDDLANRNVAQCSAENIMQWCTFLENFSFSQQAAPHLASEVRGTFRNI